MLSTLKFLGRSRVAAATKRIGVSSFSTEQKLTNETGGLLNQEIVSQASETKIADSPVVANNGENIIGAYLNMKGRSKQAIINISAKLEDSSDSKVVQELFIANCVLVREVVTLQKRNSDLLSQVFTSLPNYVKIKEELEAKFEAYKAELETDKLSCDVQHAKSINELKRQNTLLQKENDELKALNKFLSEKITTMEEQMNGDREKITAMEEQRNGDRERITSMREQRNGDRERITSMREQMNSVRLQMTENRERITSMQEQMNGDRGKITSMQEQMNSDRAVSAMLLVKLEDMEFKNSIADVFRFLRDGVIGKNQSAEFSKGTSPLPLLKYAKELESDDEDEDDDEEDYPTDEERAKSKVDKKIKLNVAREGNRKAVAFIASLGLDPTLILDLYKFNKGHNNDTHDEDCKLLISKKLTSAKNQKALGEISDTLVNIHEKNAAFYIKDRLLAWVTASRGVSSV